MKSRKCMVRSAVLGRPPHGGRGLKCYFWVDSHRNLQSPSARRAWIEIRVYSLGCESGQSPSARRAWIEIVFVRGKPKRLDCRPPHGGRGLKYTIIILQAIDLWSPSARRAWIEILKKPRFNVCSWSSPSARRAWIEMPYYAQQIDRYFVALRTEGVD